jgi:3D (Asp-Asp-Asp) domain-containing protein
MQKSAKKIFMPVNADIRINQEQKIENRFLIQSEYTIPDPCYLDEVVCPNEIIRTITAYTPSPDETDETPCITASGVNICDGTVKQSGLRVIATNELPLWSKVEIDGVVYTVLDRMNERYFYRYDILVSSKDEAKKWGVQIKKIIKL